ncbi:Uncharacterised protein [Enterobacter cloacae]|nr:Uncharacterised protein [Enterobacter cloacae]
MCVKPLNISRPAIKARSPSAKACNRLISIVNPSEQFKEIQSSLCWNALNEAFHSGRLQAVKRGDIVRVYRYRFGNLLFATGVMHISDVNTGDGHAALDQR